MYSRHFLLRHLLFDLRYSRRGKCRMAAQTNGTNGVPDASPENAPRKLKILMLHGYTQNGHLFHAKTRSIEKQLIKTFPPLSTSTSTTKQAKPQPPPSALSKLYPGGIHLLYPTAPLRLQPADIPGFDVSAAQVDDSESDAWGWWKRETGGGRYLGIEMGLDGIAGAIREAGGIDGVIGFSQGAAAAGMVASLLEKGRKAAFEAVQNAYPDALGYPVSWEEMVKETGQGPLKFAVSYSGFYSPNELYQGFYEPPIGTPMCHFIGSLDSVVEESRSLALVDVCVHARKLYHPGGHFVPAGKEMVSALVAFIRECCKEKEEEESVEDMDVPF